MFIYKFIFLFLFINAVLALRCKTASPSNCVYNSTCSYTTKECNSSQSSSVRGGMYCTTVIKIVGEVHVGNMDCMYDQETTKTCKNQSQCIIKYINKEKEFLHCCCDKDFCNLNFTLTNVSQIDSITTNDQVVESGCKGSFCKQMYIIVLSSIIGFVFILIIICFVNRQKLFQHFNQICRRFADERNDVKDPFLSVLPVEQDTDRQIDFNHLVIEDFIRKGRFSLIHVGRLNNDKVAVKILSDYNHTGESKTLFEREQQIYSSPFMEHENILKYYGYSIANDKYYLITEFSEYGSLRDVLRSRLLKDENELIFLCQSISNGISYLHTDFRNNNSETVSKTRAPIAHRDLKSDNILYINEKKIVICDFAMSTKLDQNINFPNEQQQIGTPRYMSPEILVGAIGFEPNALLKCDVYALGIIFWEILSRCPTLDPNETYEMPYEKQLIECKFNVNPQVHDMLKIINLKSPNNRPLIPSSWKDSKSKSINEVFITMEECWDQNPDARINAHLVALRIGRLTY